MIEWIQTYTGKQFYPLSPRVEDIDVRDISHALAMQCRFNGHCRTFYSVAEHSVRVSHVVPAEHALWGLLHDAAEAYLTDLPKPVKQQTPLFIELEDKLLRVILEHSGLTWPMPAEVAAADEALLATEARDLMAAPPADWQLGEHPLDERIEPVSPSEAERLYLARFNALM